MSRCYLLRGQVREPHGRRVVAPQVVRVTFDLVCVGSRAEGRPHGFLHQGTKINYDAPWALADKTMAFETQGAREGSTEEWQTVAARVFDLRRPRKHGARLVGQQPLPDRSRVALETQRGLFGCAQRDLGVVEGGNGEAEGRVLSEAKPRVAATWRTIARVADIRPWL